LIDYSFDGKAVSFSVRVVPRSSKSGVAGEHDGMLKVRIAAPPVDGAANDELVKTLAKVFQVPARSVQIISGLSSKTKRVRIEGVDPDALLRPV
jgi:hypothetical protein